MITEEQLKQVYKDCMDKGGRPEMMRVYNRATWEEIRKQFYNVPDYWPKFKDLRAIEQRLGRYASRAKQRID